MIHRTSLSPDNFIQAPGFTQSYNRYSYVLNNPLKYTDPSGQITNNPYNRRGKDWHQEASDNDRIHSDWDRSWREYRNRISGIQNHQKIYNSNVATLRRIFGNGSFAGTGANTSSIEVGELSIIPTPNHKAIKAEWLKLRAAGKYMDATRLVIKEYGLDFLVQGKYNLKLRNNMVNPIMTTGGQFNANQLITIDKGYFYEGFSAFVYGVSHEIEHVYQRTTLKMKNQATREFFAYYHNYFSSSLLPSSTKTFKRHYHSQAVHYYLRMPLSLKVRYSYYGGMLINNTP